VSRSSRKSRFPALFILLAAVVCCAGGLVYSFAFIPAQVEGKFGAPDPNLSTLQRLQYTFQVYKQENSLLRPAGQDEEKTLFAISPNESVNSISERLVTAGLVQSGQALRDYLIYRGFDRSLQSGEFYLSATMNAIEIADKIHSSTGDRTKFATLAGWRVEEVAASLESYGLNFTSDEFIFEVKHPGRIDGIPAAYQKYPSLEGFLFPASYPIDRDIQADGLISQMVNSFDGSITSRMKKGYQKNGLSLYQAVILASIVEKESVLDEEKPIIASVFYNRIATGMNLETDPTVQYALGYNGKMKTWWTNPLSGDDLQTKSSYNTYIHSGLPPTPICSPGIESLRAVAFPADTHYYYFRAACNNSGKHNFATTLDEHIQNACP
jgi:UPF0755 protein